jgi:hypothetical protein
MEKLKLQGTVNNVRAEGNYPTAFVLFGPPDGLTQAAHRLGATVFLSAAQAKTLRKGDRIETAGYIRSRKGRNGSYNTILSVPKGEEQEITVL